MIRLLQDALNLLILIAVVGGLFCARQLVRTAQQHVARFGQPRRRRRARAAFVELIETEEDGRREFESAMERVLAETARARRVEVAR